MFSKIKIGDMSQLNTISVQALRYYEQKGLLFPVEVDEKTGYRFYDIQQSAQVDIIQLLQALNFSLDEIKEFLEVDEQQIERKLTEKEKELIILEKEIQYKLNLIHSLKQANQEFKNFQQQEQINLVEFQDRYLYTFPIEKNIYSLKIDEYEYYLRQFKQHLNATDFPVVFNCIGSILDREKFINGNFYSDMLYIMLNTSPQFPYHNYLLQAGTYAVTYCDCFEKETEILGKFRRELLQAKYEILGDYICEVVYEFPKNRNNKREMFIRLQVRVKNDKTANKRIA